MNTVKTRGRDLKVGDRYVVVGGVAEIVGYYRIAKGGRLFQVRGSDGVLTDALFDGRRTYDVVVEQA